MGKTQNQTKANRIELELELAAGQTPSKWEVKEEKKCPNSFTVRIASHWVVCVELVAPELANICHALSTLPLWPKTPSPFRVTFPIRNPKALFTAGQFETMFSRLFCV